MGKKGGKIMTNEEMRNAIQFIVDQQAKMVANQMKTDERMTNIENVVLSLAHTMEKVVDTVEKVVDVQAETNERLNILTGTVEKMVDTVEKVADAQAETNERLNILINTVERFISESRDGKA
jgi:ABC-type transporter Mla subunit MlaD